MFLFFGEIGGVFFYEGGDVFGVIWVLVKFVYYVFFEGQLLFQCMVGGGVYGLMGVDQCFGWGGGKLFGNGVYCSKEVGIFDVLLDQVLGGGFFGWQFVGEQGEIYGVCYVDVLWQELGVVGIGNQVDFGKGLEEGS